MLGQKVRWVLQCVAVAVLVFAGLLLMGATGPITGSNSPVSSGSTAITINTTAYTTLLTLPAGGSGVYSHLNVLNTGSNAILVSVDGGATWMCVPGQSARCWYPLRITHSVLGTNATYTATASGVWADMS